METAEEREVNGKLEEFGLLEWWWRLVLWTGHASKMGRLVRA